MAAPLDVLLDTQALWMTQAERDRLFALVQAGQIRAHLSVLVLAERERQVIQQEYASKLAGRQNDNLLRNFRQQMLQLLFDIAGCSVLAFDRLQAQQVSSIWREWLEKQPKDYMARQVGPLQLDKHTAPERDWTVHKFDWFIAAVAQQTSWTLVTDDQGPAFQQLGVNHVLWSDFVANYLLKPNS